MTTLKHNKKRNPVFLFEILVKEFAKTKDATIAKTIRQFFDKKTELFKEYQLFKDVLQTKEESKEMAEKILEEIKTRFFFLNHPKLFGEKTELINHIHQNHDPNIFTNFVPNYKSLATIYQILHKTSTPKQAVLLEQNILEEMQSKSPQNKELKVDGIIVSKFVKRFNQTYNPHLNESQQKLLKEYVFSFGRNDLEFKDFLNTELGRIKQEVANLKEQQDGLAQQQVSEVLSLLESFQKQRVNKEMIHKILKVYNLLDIVRS